MIYTGNTATPNHYYQSRVQVTSHFVVPVVLLYCYYLLIYLHNTTLLCFPHHSSVQTSSSVKSDSRFFLKCDGLRVLYVLSIIAALMLWWRACVNRVVENTIFKWVGVPYRRQQLYVRHQATLVMTTHSDVYQPEDHNAHLAI